MTTAATTTARSSRTPRSIRVVPALALASAVIVVSVAGSATAAKMITGKQIKNGTITSLDVRNNNLTGADLKNGTVGGADVQDGSVAGADLKDGSITGADVAEGTIDGDDLANGTIKVDDLSPSITTKALTTESVAGVDLGTCSSTNPTTCDSYLELDLGEGTWMVSAGLTMANDDNAAASANNRCALVSSTGLDNLHEVRYQLAPIGEPGHLQSLSLQSVVNVGAIGTTVQVRCSEFVNEDLVLVDANLAALKVATSAG